MQIQVPISKELAHQIIKESRLIEIYRDTRLMHAANGDYYRQELIFGIYDPEIPVIQIILFFGNRKNQSYSKEFSLILNTEERRNFENF